MSLLEPPADIQKKSRAMIFTMTAAFIIAVIAVWFWLRFYPEKKAAEQFFNAVVAGDMNTAYQLWKPGPSSSYKLQDFIADWGPTGYYGPVKSYSILKAKSPNGSTSSVEVRVAISPFAPMPTVNSDPEKSQKTKVVNVWVDTKDKSFSFPP
ncbi:MAG TPA: hypothetical protein VNU23_01125 [Candidatus Cybelea sp.]|jgi:hypothetical protein|nr:hypothetical protein [Candidatus Cybelea sp.]